MRSPILTDVCPTCAAYHSLKIHRELPRYHLGSYDTHSLADATTSNKNSSRTATSSGHGLRQSDIPSHPVYLAVDVPYGDQPRLCMDIYIPAEALQMAQATETEAAALEGDAAAAGRATGLSPLGISVGSSSSGAPVMVFCHGGKYLPEFTLRPSGVFWLWYRLQNLA
jgi:hypothetical protein